MSNLNITLGTTSNKTVTWTYYEICCPRTNSLVILKACIYICIFLIGLLGNIVVIVATKRFSHLHKPTNILICNLCVCDVFILTVGLPLFAAKVEISPSDVFCKMLPSLLVTFLTCAALTLVMIAFERFVSIFHHFNKYRLTISRSFYAIIVLDIVSLVMAIPSFVQLASVDHKCVSQWSHSATLWHAVLIFLLQYIFPLIVMVILYSRSWHRIRGKNRVSIRLSKITRKTSDEADCKNKDGENNSDLNCTRKMSKLINVRKDDDHETNNSNDCTGNTLESKHLLAKSSSCHDLLQAPEGSLFRTQSCDSVNSERTHRRSRTGSFRESFRGSITRAQRSLTNIITGTDVENAQTVFAVKRYRQTMSTLKLFVYVLSVFAFCMLPYHIVNLLYAESSAISRKYRNLLEMLHLLAYMNATMNPIVYAGFNVQYRIACRKVFSASKRKVSTLFQENFFRSPSGTKIFTADHNYNKVATKKRAFLLKYFVCRPTKDVSLEQHSVATTVDYHNSPVVMGSPQKNRNKKYSAADSLNSQQDDIPISLPIIMVSNYDVEIGEENQFNHMYWYYEIETKLKLKFTWNFMRN